MRAAKLITHSVVLRHHLLSKLLFSISVHFPQIVLCLLVWLISHFCLIQFLLCLCSWEALWPNTVFSFWTYEPYKHSVDSWIIHCKGDCPDMAEEGKHLIALFFSQSMSNQQPTSVDKDLMFGKQNMRGTSSTLSPQTAHRNSSLMNCLSP